MWCKAWIHTCVVKGKSRWYCWSLKTTPRVTKKRRHLTERWTDIVIGPLSPFCLILRILPKAKYCLLSTSHSQKQNTIYYPLLDEDTYMQNPYCFKYLILRLVFPFFCKRYFPLFSRWAAWSHTWRRCHPFVFSDITCGLIRESLINLDLATVSIGDLREPFKNYLADFFR